VTYLSLLGNSDLGWNTASGAGVFYLQKFTATATGTLRDILVTSYGNTQVKVALYSDTAGVPNALLTSAGETVIGSGWNAIPVPNVQITSGTAYWLAFNVKDSWIREILNGSGTVLTKTGLYGTFAFPDPAGTGFTVNNSNYGIAGWGFQVLLVETAGLVGSTASVSTSTAKLTREMSGSVSQTTNLTGTSRTRRRLLGSISSAASLSSGIDERMRILGSISANSGIGGNIDEQRRITGSVSSTSYLGGLVGFPVEIKGSVSSTAGTVGTCGKRVECGGPVSSATHITAAVPYSTMRLEGSIDARSSMCPTIRIEYEIESLGSTVTKQIILSSEVS
jgi:hypothetical protein